MGPKTDPIAIPSILINTFSVGQNKIYFLEDIGVDFDWKECWMVVKYYL